MRRTVEAAIPGTKCMFLNGVEGDVGHVNIWAKDGCGAAEYIVDECKKLLSSV